MTARAALAALAAAATLSACAPHGVAGRTEWNPPARWDHPYTGRMHLMAIDQRHVPAACAALLADMPWITIGAHQLGCARASPGLCTVITIAAPHRGVTPGAVLRHETGHCNGWPHDHPEDHP